MLKLLAEEQAFSGEHDIASAEPTEQFATGTQGRGPPCPGGPLTAQSKPMMTSGKIGYEVGANIDATSFAGVGAVHRLAVKTGLVEAINGRLDLLKVHLPYHESDHVLNLAYNVLCGGTRLSGAIQNGDERGLERQRGRGRASGGCGRRGGR